MTHRRSDQPEFTQDQIKKRNDQRKGRELWEEVLEQYRERKRTSHMPNIQTANGGKPTPETPQANQTHRKFLDLPAELRNMVYTYYLEDDKEVRLDPKRIKRVCLSYEIYRSNRQGLGPSIIPYRCFDCHCGDYYTIEQKKRRHQLQKLMEEISEEILDRHEDLSDDAQQCFLEYKLQHALFVKRCFHEKHHNPGIVKINERGNLCADLPSLALTSKPVFEEMWGMFFPTAVDNPLKYKARVRNWDLFPLLRFINMLRTHGLAKVKGSDIQIKFSKRLSSDQIAYGNREVYEAEHAAKKFDRVKRLIEMHWLDGLPLWGCLTGLSDDEDEEDDDTGYDPDFSWKGFSEFMYAVRQMVALYRINLNSWRQLSIQYLHELFAGESWEHSLDAQIVSGVIDMVSESYFHDAVEDGRQGEELLAWVNKDLEEIGGKKLEGHTEKWHSAKAEQVERIKALFAAAPGPEKRLEVTCW